MKGATPSPPSQAGAVLPVEEIRAHFPALSRRHGEHTAVAYFDGPGGTQVPRAVVEAIADYLYQHNANTHWEYPTSHETDALIDDARQTLADFLNAAPQEIVFGANMTTLAFHLSRTLGRRLDAGDEIITTELDHHANVAPWAALARERGVVVRTVRMLTETGQLDWEDFDAQVNARTKLVAIGAASNALGTITDVSRATKAAHAVGALCFVDAVHYAPHQLVDVRSLDCDFLACSAYKFCGPHIGVLYGKQTLLESLDFPKLIPAPDNAPERAETGTQNHEGIAGAAAAIDFFASLARTSSGESRRARLGTTFSALHARGASLTARLWQGLSETSGVRLYGPTPDAPRTPTVSFTIEGIASGVVARKLAARGLFLSHGDFYAATVVERLALGVEGLVRAGCACYTTVEEVERLIQGVGEIARSGGD
ncbi:MAG TPA: cysteine desulfurase-like protein [Pyrinomonadaceae bacterium]|nr:cysteine desulfurase-like protein [Pyrinomonadaceae bacterium]